MFARNGKLREAYSQHEFLLLYGYSGCGKTTVLTQFSEKYPEFIHFIPDFTSLSPAQMLVKMGNCIGLPLKQRSSEVFALQDRLNAMRGMMYLFNEVSLEDPGSFTKLELLRKIYMATAPPICICGVPRLFRVLYDKSIPEELKEKAAAYSRNLMSLESPLEQQGKITQTYRELGRKLRESKGKSGGGEV